MKLQGDFMGLFDDLVGQAAGIAAKVGISPDQVSALTSTLQSKLADAGGDHLAALRATAEEHGVSVEKIQEILSHAGGGLADQAGGLMGGNLGNVGATLGGLFKKS